MPASLVATLLRIAMYISPSICLVVRFTHHSYLHPYSGFSTSHIYELDRRMEIQETNCTDMIVSQRSRIVV